MRGGERIDCKERVYGNPQPNKTQIGQFLILKSVSDLWQINSSLSVPLVNGNNTALLSGKPLVNLR